MDDAFKKAFNKIIDELVEKGRAEVEIRAILNAHGDKIHNVELILKDKVDECELISLRERVVILEQEVKVLKKLNFDRGKNRLAWLAFYGTLIGTIIAGMFELIKYLFTKN